MDCPRCGATDVTSPECPACGVLVAKARSARPRPERAAVDTTGPAAWRSLLLPGLGFALLAAAAVWHLRRIPADDPAGSHRAPVSAAADDGAAAAPALADLPPPAPIQAPPPPPIVLDQGAAAASAQVAADQAIGDGLSARLRARQPMSPDDLRAAEGLYARYPVAVRGLLEAVLLSLAAAEARARRFDAAEALAERAVGVAPDSPVSRRALLDVRLGQGDWASAEEAGRALLALSPGDTGAAQGLALALMRQDRTREAIELLKAFLEAHPDGQARAMLERIQREQAPEQTFDEAKLAHFHVRFDGEAHEEVGREILRALERHYATLARTFDYQPSQPVPVILLSSESYYTATGAPAWSGGQYDSFDGRVRIPIGGLTASLAPELDQTLIHELTHSFVNDLSRGAAPRELHEGLAQYMEGRRLDELDAERLRALADGRLRGVSGFYFSALGLVEELLAQRSQGGINDVLRAMSTSGVDEAFRGVYGRDMAGMQRQAREKLKQRHGS
jgi:tetratricopeptide (TPR) repeat protein